MILKSIREYFYDKLPNQYTKITVYPNWDCDRFWIKPISGQITKMLGESHYVNSERVLT